MLISRPEHHFQLERWNFSRTLEQAGTGRNLRRNGMGGPTAPNKAPEWNILVIPAEMEDRKSVV